MTLKFETLEDKQLLSATTYTEYTTDDVAVFADGEHPESSDITYNRWTYNNTDGGKINWYIYNQNSFPETETIGDLNELYVEFQNVRSYGVGLYFTVYTAPQNDGNDASSWYRSRLNFTGDYGFFQDTDDVLSARMSILRHDTSSYRYESGGKTYAQVALNLDDYSSVGLMEDSEEILYVAMSTSSGQPAATEQFSVTRASIGLNEPAERIYHTYGFRTIGSQENTVITYTSADTAIFADADSPLSSVDTVDEWAYENTEGSKINWYIYNQDLTSNSLQTLGNLRRFNMYFSKFESAGVGPYYTIYTAPQNDGLDASSWYRSRLNFVGDYSAFDGTSVSVEMNLGRIPNVTPDDASRGLVGLNLDPSTSVGPMGAGEILSYIAISTSSGQPAGTENWAVSQANLAFRNGERIQYKFTTIGDGLSSNDNFVITHEGLRNYRIDVSQFSPLLLSGYDEFFIVNTYDNDLLVWDENTQTWTDPNDWPEISFPGSWLGFIVRGRLLEDGDYIYWRASESDTGTVPVMDFFGWDGDSISLSPIETLFAELGSEEIL